MSDVNANIDININTSDALSHLKNLQAQISRFHTSIAKSSEAAALAQKSLQKNLVNSINSIGAFSAELRTVKTTAESFTTSLEKNKFSMRDYFRYAGASTKSFGKLFKSEFDTIGKVAEDRVRTLQTQYIKLGRDASGSMKALAVIPDKLDLSNYATQTQLAAQKQAIFNQLMKQGSTNLLNFGKNTQWAGRQLMVGFSLPLASFGMTASRAFMDMEEAALKFKKVYGDLGTSPAETKQALDSIKALGSEFTKYGIAASKTVGLASDAAAAGFKGVDLQRQTTEATRLSVLGQIDAQQALQTTISLQNAFNISSQDLGSTIDFLNAVENQTVTSLDDITTAIPKVAPVIQQLGGNVKDLAFFLTAMKEGGVNASEGANALKSGLASLINPTKKATDMLASMGISIQSIIQKNKGDLKATVIGFAQALDRLDPLSRARAIEQMFGKFQFARLSTLFQNVTKDGTQAAKVLDLAGASIQDLANLSNQELGITADSPMMKFKKAVEDLKVALVPVGQTFLQAVTPIIDFVGGILDKFNGLSDGVKKFITLMTVGIGVIGPVLLMTFGLFANGIANIIKLFLTLRQGYLRLTGQSQILGEQTQYLTTEQLQAQAAAHSLNQSHATLTQTFNVEKDALIGLTGAYQAALRASAAFAASNPGMMLPRVGKKMATGGIIHGPGSGTSDSIPAMLSNGEAVIPAKNVRRFPGLTAGLVAGNIPGFAGGTTGGADQFAHITDRVTVSVQQLLDTLSKMPEEMQKSKAGMISMLKDYKDAFGANLPVNVYSGLGFRQGYALNQGMKNGGSVPTQDFLSDFKSQGIEKWSTALKIGGIKLEDVQGELTKYDSALQEAVSQHQKLTGGEKITSEQFAKLEAEVRQTLPATSQLRQALTLAEKTITEYRINISESMAKDAGLTPFTKASKANPDVISKKKWVTLPSGKQVRLSGDHQTSRTMGGLGQSDAFSYESSIDKNTQDIYIVSRDRKSPHPLAAKDGADDGEAYSIAVQKSIARHERKLAKQGNVASAAPAVPTIGKRFKGMAGKVAGKMSTMSGKFGGGIGLMAANSALGMMPDFAGKSLIQDTMTGANMGMIFGPWGAAAGAAIGLVSSAIGGLIEKEKVQKAMAESVFKSSSDLATYFGNAVVNTDTSISHFGASLGIVGTSLENVGKNFGYSTEELQKFIDMVKSLPENNPLKNIINGLTDEKNPDKINKIAKAFITTQVALGQIKPDQAQKTLDLILGASGHVNMIGSSFMNLKNQTDAVSATLKNAGSNTVALGTSLTQMMAAAGNSSSLQQLTGILDGVAASGISAASALSSMYYAYLQVGNLQGADAVQALKRVNNITAKQSSLILAAVMKGWKVTINAASQGKDLAAQAEKFLNDPKLWQKAGTSSANMGSSGQQTQLTSNKELIKALKNKKKLIDDELKQEQRITQELKSQFDYQQKQNDLDQRIANAKVRGNYLEAAGLLQQKMQNTLNYKQENKVSALQQKSDDIQAQIDALQAASDAITSAINGTTGAVNSASANIVDAVGSITLDTKQTGKTKATAVPIGTGKEDIQAYIDANKPRVAVIGSRGGGTRAATLSDYDAAKAWTDRAARDRFETYVRTQLTDQLNKLKDPNQGIIISAVGSDGKTYKYNVKKNGDFIRMSDIPNKALGGLIKKYNAGGLIVGPGTGTSDSIIASRGFSSGGPIRVSNGEYIMKSASVKQYGISTMNSINNGTASVGSNAGGTVYNIDMTINGGNNNPNEIADQVIRKLNVLASKNNKSNMVGRK